ncbi:radical SAM protein [Zoogloea sp.]|uniref:radical SAM protein n=1 Tax=Zoogloea sp. TaxID=49181 RepID=UPI00262F9BAF|nr:radical SAM protein [Zoogloea sp.]MDD3352585.1 radical SAM protein [Zoogloea sp.]
MNQQGQMLTVSDHNRCFSTNTYIYPVVSRRAGGVSVGINLNPNNACNWHCAYCQVPGLVRGSAPDIDLELLERELRSFLQALLQGTFMEEHVPEDARVIRDIAFSGNGEPTSCKAFARIVERVIAIRDEWGLAAVPVRLITNGSLVDRPYVQEGLRRLARAGGEVWFKVDAGRGEDIARINGVEITPEAHARRLALCARLCPTWVQTCMFRWDGALPDGPQLEAWQALLEQAGLSALRGVLLYGVARESHQPEAVHLDSMTLEELEAAAVALKAKGLTVLVSP